RTHVDSEVIHMGQVAENVSRTTPDIEDLFPATGLHIFRDVSFPKIASSQALEQRVRGRYAQSGRQALEDAHEVNTATVSLRRRDQSRPIGPDRGNRVSQGACRSSVVCGRTFFVAFSW